MKVIILAGGKATRLNDYTTTIPKPMVKVGNMPILIHIINIYSHYGHDEFFIAAGYKHNIIFDYFKKKGDVIYYKKNHLKVKYLSNIINIIFTGLNTKTSGRLIKLKNYVEDENFLLTYGDGLSDININTLTNFHFNHKKIVTITAVHPPARFGELFLNKNNVIEFKEKIQLRRGWINGGFFVLNKKIFKFLKIKNMFENDLESLVRANQIKAYKHQSFWQCMDNLRDYELLNKLWKKKIRPWVTD